MPLNEAIQAAKDIDDLRAKLGALQNSVAEIDSQRTRVQSRIDEIRLQIVAKRAELRAAASDL